MVKNELDAEDLLQNSFVDVYSNLGSFKYQSSIGAWIKRIVVNNCINYLKRKRLLTESLDDKFVRIAEERPMPKARMSVEAINKAVQYLPDGYRVVFSLYMFEGYDHKEIASILKISEATSKSQFSRAKKKLKELLESKSYV